MSDSKPVRFPGTLRVGCFDYDIKQVKGISVDGGEAWGMICHDTSSILIKQGASEQQKANTLFHEALHAAWFAEQLPQKHEERAVTCLTNRLLAMWQDNPGLFAYLDSVVKAKPRMVK